MASGPTLVYSTVKRVSNSRPTVRLQIGTNQNQSGLAVAKLKYLFIVIDDNVIPSLRPNIRYAPSAPSGSNT